MSVTILDGGVGQELVKRSPADPTPLWSTRVMLDEPDLVRAVHEDFFAAGASVATTNSYAVHHDRLVPAELDHEFEDLHLTACRLATAARDAHGSGQIAGSLGPLGWSYSPHLAPESQEAAPYYSEIAKLQAPHVDMFLCETMSSVDQARGALMGVHGVGRPIWLAVSTPEEDGALLRSGEPLADVLPLVEEFDVAALLVNCTLPEMVATSLPILKESGVPIGAYANGFTKILASYKTNTATVGQLTAREDLSPERYADFAETWAELGATIIGGCCEIGPEHIAELKRRFTS